MIASECTGVTPSAGDMRSPQTKPISRTVRNSNDRVIRKSNSPTVAETLDNAEWYHGRLSRRNACELLQDNGDFLVRLARSKTDSLLKAVLSVRWNGRHYHFEIRERHGFFSVEEVRFDSIVSLIQHYLSKQCPITRRSAAVIKQAVPRVEYLDAPFILRGTVNVMVACLIIVFLYICSIM
uniref:SH2 domain-containing protein n=1 Tax=Parascaris univalens TaxID=6257 RepID=A0A915BNI4_PARUN